MFPFNIVILDNQKYNLDSFFKIIVFLCLIEIIPPWFHILVI